MGLSCKPSNLYESVSCTAPFSISTNHKRKASLYRSPVECKQYQVITSVTVDRVGISGFVTIPIIYLLILPNEDVPPMYLLSGNTKTGPSSLPPEDLSRASPPPPAFSRRWSRLFCTGGGKDGPNP